MRKRLMIFSTSLLTLAGTLVPSTAAVAQIPTAVTLRAKDPSIVFGRALRLKGRIDPAQPEQRVEIFDEKGRVRASTRTDLEGRYRITLSPKQNSVLRARWGAAVSKPLYARVQPRLRANLKKVKLFGKAVVRGRVRPRHSDAKVQVKIFRDGRLLDRRSVGIHGGRFRTRFEVRRPGNYQASISFDDKDHLFVRRETAVKTPPLPYLTTGSRSVYVRLLEKRLMSIGYYLRGANRRFDYMTRDAVLAFNKVQGRSRVGTVDAATWGVLARAHRPKARASTPDFHIEVDQTKQVLYTVRDGKVRNTIHVSTGANGATYDGVWNVYRKLEGYSPNRLYYPSYYEGNRAIHGWPSVPTYPASHGCVRVPYWTAKWIHYLAPLGTQIRIYHS